MSHGRPLGRAADRFTLRAMLRRAALIGSAIAMLIVTPVGAKMTTTTAPGPAPPTNPSTLEDAGGTPNLLFLDQVGAGSGRSKPSLPPEPRRLRSRVRPMDLARIR